MNDSIMLPNSFQFAAAIPQPSATTEAMKPLNVSSEEPSQQSTNPTADEATTKSVINSNDAETTNHKVHLTLPIIDPLSIGKKIRKSVSADDLLLLQGFTSSTKAIDDDAGSVYSVASDWVKATFFPSCNQRVAATGDDDIANFNVIKDDEDDASSSASSIHTLRYFEPSDFKLENWENLSAAQIGFAVVAGGFMCFHPVMFIAGVLTAFGTLQAAGATYDYCENSSSFLFCGRNDTAVTTIATADEKVMSDAGQVLTDDFGVVEEKKEDDTVFDKHGKSGCETDPMRQMSQITFSEDSGSLIPHESTSDSKVGSCQPEKGMSTSADVHDGHSRSLPHLDAQEALQWVDALYPPLSTMALERVEFHGLNAKEFFNVFFSDSAPFGFEAFHNIRRDKNVHYGQWEKLERVQKPCLLSDAPAVANGHFGGSNAVLHLPQVQERIIDYEAKTNSFLGPPFAKTTKVQRALQVSKRLLVLEMKTTLSDIPFSNRFFVMERWLVTSKSHPDDERPGAVSSGEKRQLQRTNAKNQQVHFEGSSNNHHHRSGKMTSTAFLTITSQVVFTQSCAFEAAILKESAKQISEISNQWNKMAQEGLKRTEETRRQRLQDEEDEDLEFDHDVELELAPKNVTNQPTADFDEFMTVSFQDQQNTEYEKDESIEVEHIGRQTSLVAGDKYRSISDDAIHDRENRVNDTTSKSKSHWRRSQRRRFSRSLSNLIGRRRSSTLSIVSTPPSSRGATPSMETEIAPSTVHPILAVSCP
jgi:hypothetical protein